MYHKILTAIEAHESSVFETALSIAIATDATLLLLHVLSNHSSDSPPAPVAANWDYATPLSPAAWRAYQQQWQAYEAKGHARLQSYTKRAEAAGVTADHLQTTDSPEHSICHTAKAWKADLIIIGSHQRKGLQELMIGSVSNYVVHHAPCSVMIVFLTEDGPAQKDISRLPAYQTA